MHLRKFLQLHANKRNHNHLVYSVRVPNANVNQDFENARAAFSYLWKLHDWALLEEFIKMYDPNSRPILYLENDFSLYQLLYSGDLVKINSRLEQLERAMTSLSPMGSETPLGSVCEFLVKSVRHIASWSVHYQQLKILKRCLGFPRMTDPTPYEAMPLILEARTSNSDEIKQIISTYITAHHPTHVLDLAVLYSDVAQVTHILNPLEPNSIEEDNYNEALFLSIAFKEDTIVNLLLQHLQLQTDFSGMVLIYLLDSINTHRVNFFDACLAIPEICKIVKENDLELLNHACERFSIEILYSIIKFVGVEHFISDAKYQAIRTAIASDDNECLSQALIINDMNIVKCFLELLEVRCENFSDKKNWLLPLTRIGLQNALFKEIFKKQGQILVNTELGIKAAQCLADGFVPHYPLEARASLSQSLDTQLTYLNMLLSPVLKRAHLPSALKEHIQSFIPLPAQLSYFEKYKSISLLEGKSEHQSNQLILCKR